MVKYKCGHKVETVILDNNIMSIIEYEIWKESDGFEGDSSKCWDCYLKDLDDYKSRRPLK